MSSFGGIADSSFSFLSYFFPKIYKQIFAKKNREFCQQSEMSENNFSDWRKMLLSEADFVFLNTQVINTQFFLGGEELMKSKILFTSKKKACHLSFISCFILLNYVKNSICFSFSLRTREYSFWLCYFMTLRFYMR